MKNSDDILLSVIVPVYNVEPYLRRCLDSILKQKYMPNEIICVDDGSTDGSSEILDEYRKLNNNIKVIHKINGGLVSARKEGLSVAKGKYISYVDSDDWIEENMYEEMLKKIEAEQADLATSGCIRDYGSHSIVDRENIPADVYEGEKLQKGLKDQLIDTNLFFKSNLSIHIYNKIFLREKLIEKQMQVDDRINIGEDAACVYPYILDSKKIVVMGKTYYHYCIRDDSIMGNPGLKEYKKSIYLKELLEKEFSKHDEVKGNMEQYKSIALYCSLLQYASKEIYYKNGVLFPYGKVSKTDRIVVYGAGRFGNELYKILTDKGFCIVGWVDKNNREGLLKVEDIEKIEFDKVLIAVLGIDMCKNIINRLTSHGIDRSKIMTVNPNN